MPTTEERLTALEQAVDDLQSEVLRRAAISAVLTLESNRDLVKDQQDTKNTAYEVRLANLERFVSTIQKKVISSILKDGSGEVTEDVLFGASSVAPVLRDSGGGKWRVLVDSSGDLSSEHVS